MFKIFVGVAVLFLIGQIMSAAFSGNTGVITTSLSGNIDDDDTVIPVASTTGYLSGPDIIFVEAEVIRYTGIGATAAACTPVAAPCFTGATRGASNTSAADHLSGVQVFNETSGIINSMMGFNVAEIQTVSNPWQLAQLPVNYFKAFVRMLTWDYAFLDSDIGQFIKLFGYALSLGVVGMLLLALISVAQGLIKR